MSPPVYPLYALGARDEIIAVQVRGRYMPAEIP